MELRETTVLLPWHQGSPRPPQPIARSYRRSLIHMKTLRVFQAFVHSVFSRALRARSHGMRDQRSRTIHEDLARLQAAAHNPFAVPSGHRPQYPGRHFVQASLFAAAQRAPPHAE